VAAATRPCSRKRLPLLQNMGKNIVDGGAPGFGQVIKNLPEK
jgi:3-hydroxyisobutyrate dehydrogenase-like beta-hydroxyacid dehydrogenase